MVPTEQANEIIDYGDEAAEYGTKAAKEPSDAVLEDKVTSSQKPDSKKQNITTSQVVGNAFVVCDPIVWNSLPKKVQEVALQRVNTVFRFGERQILEVSRVSEGQIPSQIDFIDTVVRVYSDTRSTVLQLRYHAHNQVNQLIKQVPELESVRQKIRGDAFKEGTSIGRAFALKWAFKGSKLPILVCVSESTISLVGAIAAWNVRQLFLAQKGGKSTSTPQKVALETLGQASNEVQEAIGIAIGNLISHELRHQLGKDKDGNGLEHATAGLGSDGASFTDPGCFLSPADQKNIVASMKALVQLQGSLETVSIKRNAPYE